MRLELNHFTQEFIKNEMEIRKFRQKNDKITRVCGEDLEELKEHSNKDQC